MRFLICSIAFAGTTGSRQPLAGCEPHIVVSWQSGGGLGCGVGVRVARRRCRSPGADVAVTVGVGVTVTVGVGVTVGSGFTLIVTVAVLESAVPSFTLYVKASVPEKPGRACR